MTHLEENALRTRQRRAMQRGNGGNHTLEELDQLLAEQNGLCYLCNKPLYSSFKDPIHVEHKIPVSRGGSNDISNIGLAHAGCNYEKGTLTDIEYFERAA